MLRFISSVCRIVSARPAQSMLKPATVAMAKIQKKSAKSTSMKAMKAAMKASMKAMKAATKTSMKTSMKAAPKKNLLELTADFIKSAKQNTHESEDETDEDGLRRTDGSCDDDDDDDDDDDADSNAKGVAMKAGKASAKSKGKGKGKGKVLKSGLKLKGNRLVGKDEKEGADRTSMPRDKNKATFFRRQKDNIPDDIVKIFNKNSDAHGGRQANTDLINSLVRRDANGVYTLDLHNPHIQVYMRSSCVH